MAGEHQPLPQVNGKTLPGGGFIEAFLRVLNMDRGENRERLIELRNAAREASCAMALTSRPPSAMLCRTSCAEIRVSGRGIPAD